MGTCALPTCNNSGYHGVDTRNKSAAAKPPIRWINQSAAQNPGKIGANHGRIANQAYRFLDDVDSSVVWM
jgi:hypothetical protein